MKFLKEVRAELQKVEWPTRSALGKMTAVVILVSLIVSVYLGILDIAIAKAIEVIVK